ncbi:MAG: Glucokinase [Actinomycetota bacterium]|jgi:glucokinase
MGLSIGVDLGGTKIAAGVVDENGNILASDRVPTPSLSSEAVVAAIAELVDGLRQGHDVTSVCVAAPGFVDAARSTLRFTPNLPFRNEPLGERLSQTLGLQVLIENDANAAAWAEARFGAAQGLSNVVLLTVGTGLGGGLIVDGNLVRGAFGFAAEVGHMTLVPEGEACGCGQFGCWEQYASGNALLRIARQSAQKHRSEAGILLALGDGTPEGIQGAHITAAAEAGCPIAISAFNKLGKNLGKGMATMSALLDPEMYVIGGGVCEAGDLLLAPTRAAFEKNLTALAHRPMPKIVAATLGNDAGLVGAADLARKG